MAEMNNEMENVNVTNEDVNPETTPEVDNETSTKKNLFAVALAAGTGFVAGWHAKKWDVKRVAEKELAKRKKQEEKKEKKEEKKKLKEMIKDAKANPEKYVTDADVDLEEDEN